MTQQLHEWIFWRHADASDGQVDLLRALSEYGHQQAQKSANWLTKQNIVPMTPEVLKQASADSTTRQLGEDSLFSGADINFALISSEATRARQTAAALSSHINIVPALNPGASVRAVLTALRALPCRKMIIVGHQPWIGQAVEQLLSGRPAYRAYANCDLYWLQSSDGLSWTMHTHVSNQNLV